MSLTLENPIRDINLNSSDSGMPLFYQVDRPEFQIGPVVPTEPATYVILGDNVTSLPIFKDKDKVDDGAIAILGVGELNFVRVISFSSEGRWAQVQINATQVGWVDLSIGAQILIVPEDTDRNSPPDYSQASLKLLTGNDQSLQQFPGQWTRFELTFAVDLNDLVANEYVIIQFADKRITFNATDAYFYGLDSDNIWRFNTAANTGVTDMLVGVCVLNINNQLQFFIDDVLVGFVLSTTSGAVSIGRSQVPGETGDIFVANIALATID